jgi:hypothetical protein
MPIAIDFRYNTIVNHGKPPLLDNDLQDYHIEAVYRILTYYLSTTISGGRITINKKVSK